MDKFKKTGLTDGASSENDMLDNEKGTLDDNELSDSENRGPKNVMLRLPYALAKERGISTKGLTPSEVWDKLRGCGVKPDEEKDAFLEKLKKGTLTQDKFTSIIINRLTNSRVEYNKPVKLKNTLSESEIISKISGGDLTRGSCASAALAYIANKAQLDVYDFRGGTSKEIFSRSSTLEAIAMAEGVESIVEQGYNDFSTAYKLLPKVEPGKEYYFVAGKHAAIIRKAESGYEYLELQKPKAEENGFFMLTKEILKNRFGCQTSHSILGHKVQCTGILIECQSLGKSGVFKELIGYINTPKDKQLKGEKGRAF